MIKSEHERYLAKAISLAEENVRAGGRPFGAVIVKEGAIVSAAANMVISTGDPTAHAEIIAIREACKALSSLSLAGCDVYSISEPCPMCMGALLWAQPRAVYFAASSRDAERFGFMNLHPQMAPPHRNLPVFHVERQEALDVLQAGSPRRT
jgi:guanine deaminase